MLRSVKWNNDLEFDKIFRASIANLSFEEGAGRGDESLWGGYKDSFCLREDSFIWLNILLTSFINFFLSHNPYQSRIYSAF